MHEVLIHAVFVLSGVAALLYQIIWQRALLLIYGSNSESVAMVVAAFLVGLGLGSLVGGRLSNIGKASPLVLFCAMEIGVGLYGLVSMELFRWAGEFALPSNFLLTGLLVFSLVFLPTVMMGASLPLLVAHRVNRTTHVGRSVSWLYFVNTLGGSLGAILASFVLLRVLGLSSSVKVAALLNFVTAAVVAFLIFPRRKSHAQA